MMISMVNKTVNANSNLTNKGWCSVPGPAFSSASTQLMMKLVKMRTAKAPCTCVL